MPTSYDKKICIFKIWYFIKIVKDYAKHSISDDQQATSGS